MAHGMVLARGRELTLDPATRETIAHVVLDGFWRQLRNYNLTQEQVLAYVLDSLDMSRGLYALADGLPVGVAGIADEQGRFMRYGWQTMRRHFSLPLAFFGWLAHRFDGRVRAGEWLIDLLAVAPEYRGQGVGTALLQHLIDWAPAVGIHTLMLDVVDTNTRAERLYKSMGFVRTRTRRTGVLTRKEGFEAIHYMELRITPDQREEET